MAGFTKLQRITRAALTDYLGLSDAETLLILTDETKREIALALFESAQKICAEALYMEIKPREVNGEEPPEAVAEIMKNVDAVIAPTDKSITHTRARQEASRVGVRVATMPGITMDSLIRCFSADLKEIGKITYYVNEAMRKTEKIRVTSEAGTDVAFEIGKRRVIDSTGILRGIGEYGNIPSGEVYVAPIEESVEGTIVFDGSMAGVGLLKQPIVLEVEKGSVTKVSGKTEARTLSRLLNKMGDKAKMIGEFGIGTNPKAEICGEILEDEKALGTVHFALGSNVTFGGKIDAGIHLDGLIKEPDVWFDDEKIMEKGELLLEME